MDDRNEHRTLPAGNRAASPLKIVLNGAAEQTSATTLAELVAGLDLAPEQVATALNGHFIARSRRGTCQLTDGDRIEIVSPRQGG